MREQRSKIYAQALSDLIKIETISENGKTHIDKFRKFQDALRDTFPNIFKIVEFEDFEGSILMRWRGNNADLEPVLFMNHQDVVEATGNWKYPAFSGKIVDGKVWGRGTLDTKGGLWAMLQAAEELYDNGFVPERDLYFVSTCSEETDGSGAAKIAHVLEERHIHFHMILDEGGMIMYDPIGGADGTFAMVGVGEKSIADLKFVAKSTGGHASTPGKDTPLVRLGKFMAEVDRKEIFKKEVSPVVKEMLLRFAPYMSGPLKIVCKHPKLFQGPIKLLLPKFSASAGALIKTTIAFTMAKGSDGTNVLPQEAWVVGDMRCSHHQGGKNSIKQIKKIAKKYNIETEVATLGIESELTDFNGEIFKLVEKAVDNCFDNVKTVPYVMTGASDARFFNHLTNDCIHFVPIQIDEQQYESIHGINENVSIDSLAPAVDFYKYIMKEV